LRDIWRSRCDLGALLRGAVIQKLHAKNLDIANDKAFLTENYKSATICSVNIAIV